MYFKTTRSRKNNKHNYNITLLQEHYLRIVIMILWFHQKKQSNIDDDTNDE